MNVIVNGERTEVPPGTTVAEMVARFGMQPRYVAVERNEQLVPRAQHGECVLKPDDRLEIVTLVGGG